MIMDGMPHAEYDSTKGVEVFYNRISEENSHRTKTIRRLEQQ